MRFSICVMLMFFIDLSYKFAGEMYGIGVKEENIELIAFLMVFGLFIALLQDMTSLVRD